MSAVNKWKIILSEYLVNAMHYTWDLYIFIQSGSLIEPLIYLMWYQGYSGEKAILIELTIALCSGIIVIFIYRRKE